MPAMRTIGILVGVLLLAGCATPAKFTTDTLERGVGGEHRILLMPVDVELSVLQASGILEPRAALTGPTRPAPL